MMGFSLPTEMSIFAHPIKPFREKGTQKIIMLPLNQLSGIESYFIDFYSCSAARKALQHIAYYSKREGGWDNVQYSASEHKNLCSWIVCQNEYNGKGVIGGGCFRYRTYIDESEEWAMQWLWIHPYARNKGIITSLWPSFLEKFGDFPIEKPLSKQMEGFVSKYGTEKQKKNLICNQN